MKGIRAFVLVSVVGIVLFSGLPLTYETFQPRSAFAQNDWEREFEDVCSKADDSMRLPKEDLGNLISRCDKLKPVIEKLDESTKKVYLKRLKMCKDLLEFALESKK